jgi:hypothetical protein
VSSARFFRDRAGGAPKAHEVLPNKSAKLDRTLVVHIKIANRRQVS